MARRNCILTELGLEILTKELIRRNNKIGDNNIIHGLTIQTLATDAGISYEWATRIKKQKPGVTEARILEVFDKLGLDPPEYGEHYVELEISEAPRDPVLPTSRTQFIGRDAQIQALTALFEKPEIRLITLTGIGGIGKTRLAAELGERLSARWEGRVWLVPLEGLRDASAMLNALAKTLNPSGKAGPQPLTTIAKQLGQASCLIILDGFERLLDDPSNNTEPNDSPASPLGVVRVLLDRFPQLTCFVTSQQNLEIQGEQKFVLEPMLTPEQSQTPDVIMQCESVKLFTDRARTVAPDFAITSENIGDLISLSKQLEGHPLALEIIASWADVLTLPAMLRERQAKGVYIETAYKDLPARHRNLWAVLHGSYDRASPELQTFLAASSVFRGGWTLQAAEALDKNATRHLKDLQNRSLVVREKDGSGKLNRFRFLKPIWEFAAIKFGETSSSAARQHRDFFLNLATQAHEHMEDDKRGFYMDSLEADYQNVCEAIRFCLAEAEGAEAGLKMTGALQQFWQGRGYVTAGRQFLTSALERSDAQQATQARALALNAVGVLATIQGDYANANSYLHECLTIGEQIGSKQAIKDALGNLGMAAMLQGDDEKARERFSALLLLQFADENDKLGLAKTYLNLADVNTKLGNFLEAQPLFEESVAHCRALKNKIWLAAALMDYAELLRRQEDYAEAQIKLAECLPLLHEGDKNRHGVAYALGGFADLAHHQKQPARAARLYGAVRALREADAMPLPPPDQDEQDRELAKLEIELGPGAYALAFDEGRSLTVAQAVEEALRKAEA